MKAWWKKCVQRLQNPPALGVALTFVCLVCGVAGALTMVAVGYTGVFSYIVYVFAAVSLAYATYLTVRFAPRIKAGGTEILQRWKFTRELTADYSFRTVVFAVCSLIVNLGFVAFNTAFAIWTGSIWYASLAGYYFLLSGLRAGVFYLDKRAKGEERSLWKNYRLCGAALFALDLAMAVAVTYMVVAGKPTKYSEIMAIVFAAYTFYKLSLAIWNIFKAKRTQDLQVQAFRNISLADAAISLLSLQTTLVSTFAVEGTDMTILNALTGACVCLMTVALGVLMIVKGNKGLKKYGK